MFQKAPQTITTTELQRNPKILGELNEGGEMRVIIRESEQVGVYSPIKEYNKLIDKLEKLEKQLALRDLELAETEVEMAKNTKKGLNSLKDADDLLE